MSFMLASFCFFVRNRAQASLPTMKTLLQRLSMVLLGGAVLVLSSCVYPYAGYSSYGTLNRGYASPPLRTSYYSVRSAPIHRSYYSGSPSYTACAPRTSYSYGSTAYRSYTPNYARPYYSNYGYGRPHSDSTWYRQPYTSTWRDPGYTRYNNYSSPLVSYGYPMSHNGGWSYSRFPMSYGNSYGFGNSFGRNFCY
jgi:hypothetical protein